MKSIYPLKIDPNSNDTTVWHEITDHRVITNPHVFGNIGQIIN